MAKRKQPEKEIHKAVVEYLERFAFPDVLWFHPPNGGKRSPQWAMELKRMGVKPGVPDLILYRRGRAFALELKAEDGRPTEAQLAWIGAFNNQGFFGAIVTGFDRAIGALKAWELVK